jgi:(p)ppGpp synthase/HD superfamily hydrolase
MATLYKTGELLNKMLIFVVNKHAGQFDKGGRPYVLHCLAVMHKLRTDDEELQCIAIGHDVIEDTDATYQDLRDIGMTERVIDGIRCMTKVPGETYDEYKVKVKSNVDSRKAKKKDLGHNSDIRRLKGVTDKDIARLARYFQFYMELDEMDKEDNP